MGNTEIKEVTVNDVVYPIKMEASGEKTKFSTVIDGEEKSFLVEVASDLKSEYDEKFAVALEDTLKEILIKEFQTEIERFVS